MPLLVAAATDQTGRTITILSAGLVAVALGLTALTIWYWRFTSPRRRATSAAAVIVHRPVVEEPPTVGAPPVVASPAVASPAESAEPVEEIELSQPVDPPEPSPPEDQVEPSDPVEPSEWVELWAAGDTPDEPEQIHALDPEASVTHTDEPPIGLDSEQWTVLAQAVLDEYLDS